MTTTDIHHLAAAYALDAVDADERRAFEAHYATCDVCRVDVVDHRETLARIAASMPVAPGPDVRDRVLAEIARTRQLSPVLPDGVTDLAERRRRRRRAVSTTVLAAAAVMLVVAAGALVVGRDGVGGFGEQAAAVFEAPDAQAVTIDSDTATGSVRLVWSERTGRVAVFGDGLAPAGDGLAYELWAIGPDGPVPMTLLDPAVAGSLRRVLPLVAAPTAWGVTIEPATGSPAPTGDIVFLAEV